MKLSNPWPAGETIRSPWGYRKHPITGRRKKHRGVDVGYNGPIYAPADGKVVHKGASLNKRTGGGYTLILEHQSPRVWTVYYHLREPSRLLKGTRVKRGEVIALRARLGRAQGSIYILKLGAHSVGELTSTPRVSFQAITLPRASL